MSTDVEITEATAQLASVDQRITEVYAEIGVLAAAQGDFSGQTLEYGALLSERGTLRIMVNGKLIEDEKSAVFQAIGELIASSNLPTLLSEPITTLVWESKPGSGENGPIQELRVNPSVVTAGKGRAKASTGGKGSGRVKYTDGSMEYTAREMVLKFATEDILKLSLVAHGEGKWVTKPEHVASALTAAEAAGVNLTQVVVASS